MCKIMVIEDNRVLRTLYKHVLQKYGFEVAEAEDGYQALEILEKSQLKPDIILLDYRLPTINGFELSKEILARNHSSKILMITGDPQIDRELVTPLGIRFRKKPITLTELIMEINSLKLAPIAD